MKIPFDVDIFPVLHLNLTSQCSHAPAFKWWETVKFLRVKVNGTGPRERLWVYLRRYSFFVDWSWL